MVIVLFNRKIRLVLLLCVLVGWSRVAESGRVEDVDQALQYQWTESCPEPGPVVNTRRHVQDSQVNYTCLEGTQHTSGSLDVPCPTYYIPYPTCTVDCGEPLKWDGFTGLKYRQSGGNTLGDAIEYTCSDLGTSNSFISICTGKGWSKADIICRDTSLDLAAGLDLSVVGDASVDMATGCVIGGATSQYWVGVKFEKGSIDPYVVRVFDDPSLQSQIIDFALTIRMSRGGEIVEENVTQAVGAEFHVAGRDIGEIWLTYTGMQRICAIHVYGQPHLGGCPTLFPPYPAVLENASLAGSARLDCQSGFVYAGGSRDMYCDIDRSWKFVGSSPIQCRDAPNLGHGAHYLFYTSSNAGGLDSLTYSQVSGLVPESGAIALEVNSRTLQTVLIVELLGNFVIERIVMLSEGARVLNAIVATEGMQNVAACQILEDLSIQGTETSTVLSCDSHPVGHNIVITLSVDEISVPILSSVSNLESSSEESSSSLVSTEVSPEDQQQSAPTLSPGADHATSTTSNSNTPQGHAYGSHRHKRKKRHIEGSTTVKVQDLTIIGSTTLNGVLECFQTEDGRDYKGHVNVSYRGQDCLNWSDHATNLGISDFDLPDLTLEDAGNYCRNPKSLRKRPWCVTNEGREWCTVLPCKKICSSTSYGFDYVGQLQATHSGQSCIPWTTDSLPFINEDEFSDGERDHSYCRNPAHSQSRPWCYVTESISQLCVVPRCPTKVGTFSLAESSISNFFVTWLYRYISSSYQTNCYRLNNDEEEASVNELYLQDVAPYCDGTDRYVTAVCSFDAQLYEEHNTQWYHTVIDCGPKSTTASPSTSQTSTIAPSSSQTSTIAPSSSQTSTIAPSSSQTSTIAPSSSQTSTIAPSSSQTSTIAPSSSQTSTIAPSTSQTSTIAPSSSQISTIALSSSQTSTIAPSSSQTSTIAPSSGQTSTIAPSSGQTSTIAPASSQTSTIAPAPSQTSQTTPASTLLVSSPSSPSPTSVNTAWTTQSAAVKYPSQKLCPCDCAWNPNAVYTDKQVQAMVDKINKELTVPKKNLSSAIRAKTCAKDSRESAISTGVAGLALIALAGGLVLSLDFLGLLTYIRAPSTETVQ